MPVAANGRIYQVYKRRVPEVRRHDMPLGRHVYHDERSKDYPAPMAAAVRDVEHGSTGLPLNQGSVGKCTAEALCGCGNTTPNEPGVNPRTGAIRVYNDQDSDGLYIRETTDEGYPYPEYDPGGSGLAVCKAAKELGWIKSYTHTFSPQDALKALVLRPGMVGSNWYDSMDAPDSNGVVSISPNASIRGGHEYFAHQLVLEEQLIGFWNSWGNWGPLVGRFYMKFATIERLLGEQGDFTFPIW